VPVADPARRKREEDLAFRPIPSPIHPVGHEPGPWDDAEIGKGHFVLSSESGY
jgi:hypothetical protein